MIRGRRAPPRRPRQAPPGGGPAGPAVRVACQWSLYPLGVPGYMDVIYREIKRTKESVSSPAAQHFVSRLDGELSAVLQAVRRSFDAAGTPPGTWWRTSRSRPTAPRRVGRATRAGPAAGGRERPDERRPGCRRRRGPGGPGGLLPPLGALPAGHLQRLRPGPGHRPGPGRGRRRGPQGLPPGPARRPRAGRRHPGLRRPGRRRGGGGGRESSRWRRATRRACWDGPRRPQAPGWPSPCSSPPAGSSRARRGRSSPPVCCARTPPCPHQRGAVPQRRGVPRAGGRRVPRRGRLRRRRRGQRPRRRPGRERRRGRPPRRPGGGAWRTQDYVFLAVLAIVSGALYWWWLQPYSWVVPLVPGAGQVAQEAIFGVWFLSGLLGGT